MGAAHWACANRRDFGAPSARGFARLRPGCLAAEVRTTDTLKIGNVYDTTYGTLWKDGTYFSRGTRVSVAGLHLDQGFCVRFPAEVDGEPLETWEDWSEIDFLAEAGSVTAMSVPATVLAEAREVLTDAEDGCHLHLHEEEDEEE